jgi:hypothetical protein
MRRPLIGARDFETFIGQRNKLKESHGGLPRERVSCVCEKEKKRRIKCEEGFSSYVWRSAHGKVCARIKHGRKLCVANTCRKAFGFLFQLVVPPKSIVGFVSNLIQFLFRRCSRFSPNFIIIRFIVRELHLLEIEGVCNGIHGRIFMIGLLEFCFKLFFTSNPLLNSCQI